MRDPPVPIPNTEVKPHRAESTWLATAREDRSPPDSKFKEAYPMDMLLFFLSIAGYNMKQRRCLNPGENESVNAETARADKMSLDVTGWMCDTGTVFTVASRPACI